MIPIRKTFLMKKSNKKKIMKLNNYLNITILS